MEVIQSSSVIPQNSDDDSTPSAKDAATLRAIELTALLRKRGASLQASDPRVIAWAKAGVSDASVLAALEKAQQRRVDTCDPSPINAGYLDSILKSASPPGIKAGAKPSLAEQNAVAFAEAKRMIFGEEATS